MESETPPRGFATRLTHGSRPAVRSHGFVNPPLHRGSTVLQPSCEARVANGKRRFERVMTYGTQGGPTHYALEDMVADIEGGTHCTIVGTGLAAVAVPLLAFLKAGDHCLMPDSAYGPARNLAEGLMTGWGIETQFYDPRITAEGLAGLWRPNTRVLYLESPGSHTFEVQDVPALTALARARGAVSILDNTWGIHNFQPFARGCDVSVQALTKYVGGHSDILLGSVTVNSRAHHEAVRSAAAMLGQYASPDDCWLALRGVRTMAVRLRHQAQAALEIARWIETRPEIAEVWHPALPSHPDHAIFARDFSGACSLFGMLFQPRYTEAEIFAFVDGLRLFGIGASWGGYESLALPTNVAVIGVAPDPPLERARDAGDGVAVGPDRQARDDRQFAQCIERRAGPAIRPALPRGAHLPRQPRGIAGVAQFARHKVDRARGRDGQRHLPRPRPQRPHRVAQRAIAAVDADQVRRAGKRHPVRPGRDRRRHDSFAGEGRHQPREIARAKAARERVVNEIDVHRAAP
ncbi:cystathionine beta-lyase [Leptolyngbya sp. 15MV]|nr:cystathionine beta-lyase [Leptolyngbya sp. 15MV]